MVYTQDDMLRIAKRYNNSKRTYLLVNTMQAKHIPVEPERALDMMRTLGTQIAKKYPESRLVIGFAETATAIGAMVAESLSKQCVYLQTTREDFTYADEWITFLEEHSHAVNQKLSGDSLAANLSLTDTIIFVDDEITTGKTLINMVEQMKSKYPCLQGKKLVAASVFNRVSEENEEKMAQAGIHCEYLIKLPQEDYSAKVSNIDVREAEPVASEPGECRRQELLCEPLEDPRAGVHIGHYTENCEAMANAFIEQTLCGADQMERVLVLGTEECMYPALILGRQIQQQLSNATVRCHATTRSPIGIADSPEYPIINGVKLKSFYDPDRMTYLYDLNQYDAVIVVSDAPENHAESIWQLASAMRKYGTDKLYCIQGGKHVWYI